MITKSGAVELELQRRIISGDLEAGERLPAEDDLARSMGCSRTAIRDAMRSLAARHLVTVRHGFGMEVAPPTQLGFAHAFADMLIRSDLTVGDALDARQALDCQLAPLVTANATDADAEALRRALGRFEDEVARDDTVAAQEAHLDFHVALLRAMHQPALELMLAPVGEVILLSSLRPSDDPFRFELESHRPIAAALESGDAGALTAAIEQHYAVTRGPAYEEFRAARFRDLMTHDDFVELRRRLSGRAEEVAR